MVTFIDASTHTHNLRETPSPITVTNLSFGKKTQANNFGTKKTAITQTVSKFIPSKRKQTQTNTSKHTQK